MSRAWPFWECRASQRSTLASLTCVPLLPTHPPPALHSRLTPLSTMSATTSTGSKPAWVNTEPVAKLPIPPLEQTLRYVALSALQTALHPNYFANLRRQKSFHRVFGAACVT